MFEKVEIKEKDILPPSFTLSIEGGVSEVYDVNKTHTLTVTANGDEAYTYTYQWFKDGVAIAGATQSTYTVSVVADSGEYYCVVSVDGTVEETDKVTVEITVKDLAMELKKTSSEVIKKLFGLGIMATINNEVDFDTAFLISEEFGVTAIKKEVVNEEDENSIDYEYERYKRILDEELKKMEDL